MKIGVVVASEHALPTAFSVFRGVEHGIHRAAELGYDGIELAVRDGSEYDPVYLSGLLKQNNVEIAAISTGQLFADKGLWLSARDDGIRTAAIREFCKIIDMAAKLSCLVNIGRARGFVETVDTWEATTERFSASMQHVAAYAQEQGVQLVLEPVNRYETNYINNLTQGAQLIEHLRGRGVMNLRLMPDTFHMNIEDASIEGCLRQYRDMIGYIHVADSNRLAPGWGHIDFEALFHALEEIGYDQWISVEALPTPDADAAAKQAIAYLRKHYHT